jgi:Mn-dependent DtxR family transcriptional regulator
MNKEQLAELLRAVGTLDRAAVAYGQKESVRTHRLYRAALSRLVNMLKDIAAIDAGVLDANLTDDERAALREVIQQVNGGLPSPTRKKGE